MMTLPPLSALSTVSASTLRSRPALAGGGLLISVLLSACGGGQPDAASGINATAQAVISVPTAQPTYHLAPVHPGEPEDIDADGSGASAWRAPRQLQVDSALLAPGLTARALPDALPGARAVAASSAHPLSTSSLSFLTPAQVRTLYGLSNLPAATANKGASQGSGQLIAIIGAFHLPTVAADLATFSQKFGLPGCTLAQPSAAQLASVTPVSKPAAGSGCTLQVLYANANGAVTTTAPAVDKGWATEMSLDVQWAHAIAPMASIVLIESPNASSMTAGLTLAKRTGASVVSMSWGSSEFSGQGNLDSLFNASGVSYVASSGDAGYGVLWPAASASVLGVGGTQLLSASLPRQETSWSDSGGGVSSYTAAPSWQGVAKSLAGSHRAVPDVAYNASPNSAVYVYMSPNSQTGGTGWVGAGGTSAGAPQWAGIVAVLNATRVAAGKPTISALPATLYTNIAARPGVLATTLKDITTGSNGSCSLCQARSGYDLVTGLGSPYADVLISTMSAL